MLRYIRKQIFNIKQRVTPLQPMCLPTQELTKIFYEQQVCPDCGVWDFREGPSGGAAINIFCANCGSWFNEQGPFGLDRIFKEENLDWRTYSLGDSDSYYSYTWDILKEWYCVEFKHDDAVSRKGLFSAIDFCTTEDITGQWSIKDYTVYLEEESDAIAVKLACF